MVASPLLVLIFQLVDEIKKSGKVISLKDFDSFDGQ